MSDIIIIKKQQLLQLFRLFNFYVSESAVRNAAVAVATISFNKFFSVFKVNFF